MNGTAHLFVKGSRGAALRMKRAKVRSSGPLLPLRHRRRELRRRRQASARRNQPEARSRAPHGAARPQRCGQEPAATTFVTDCSDPPPERSGSVRPTPSAAGAGTRWCFSVRSRCAAPCSPTSRTPWLWRARPNTGNFAPLMRRWIGWDSAPRLGAGAVVVRRRTATSGAREGVGAAA